VLEPHHKTTQQLCPNPQGFFTSGEIMTLNQQNHLIALLSGIALGVLCALFI
jgi:hypothetical protein